MFLCMDFNNLLMKIGNINIDKTLFLVLFSVLVLVIPAAIPLSFSQAQNSSATSMTASNQTNSNNNSVKNSQTILLEGTHLPSKSYLHLYDSKPFKIMNSHISAKVPCNDTGYPAVLFLFGPDTKVPTSGFKLDRGLSQLGELCLYRGDLAANQTNNISDIAIYNNSTRSIEFPPTSTIILNINEVMPVSNNNSTQ